MRGYVILIDYKLAIDTAFRSRRNSCMDGEPVKDWYNPNFNSFRLCLVEASVDYWHYIILITLINKHSYRFKWFSILMDESESFLNCSIV